MYLYGKPYYYRRENYQALAFCSSYNQRRKGEKSVFVPQKNAPAIAWHLVKKKKNPSNEHDSYL